MEVYVLSSSHRMYINSTQGPDPLLGEHSRPCYVYKQLAYLRIAGRYNSDSLGYVLNTLKWKDNMFILDNQYVSIF